MTEIVTTFARKQWEEYGKFCLPTWRDNLPQGLTVHAYVEDLGFPMEANLASRFQFTDLYTASPECAAFVARWRNDPSANGENGGWQFDAVRFCRKVYAQAAHAKVTKDRYMIWLDADVLIHKPMPKGFFEALLNPDHDMVYLGRQAYHTETGFILYDLESHYIGQFLKRLQDYYDKGMVFCLNQSHDCAVWDQVRMLMEAEKDRLTGRPKINPRSISPEFTPSGATHVFINCPLGEYMDHLKGESRKVRGHSHRSDLYTEQSGEWWQMVKDARKWQ